MIVWIFSDSVYRKFEEVFNDDYFSRTLEPDLTSPCYSRKVPKLIETNYWNNVYEYGVGLTELIDMIDEKGYEKVDKKDKYYSPIKLDKYHEYEHNKFIASVLYLDSNTVESHIKYKYIPESINSEVLVKLIDKMIDFKTQFPYHLNKRKFCIILKLLLNLLRDKIKDKIEPRIKKWLSSLKYSNETHSEMMEKLIYDNPKDYLDTELLDQSKLSPVIVDYAPNNNILIQLLVDFSNDENIKKMTEDELGMRYVSRTIYKVAIKWPDN